MPGETNIICGKYPRNKILWYPDDGTVCATVVMEYTLTASVVYLTTYWWCRE